jgi:cellulose biosynthesis protein BcsQ
MEIFRTRPTASGRVKVIVMCSPSGGSGTSLLCATLARCIADLGNKVVYLNFEAIPSTETFFTGDGSQYNFSDVLFCLKSGRKNIGSKADLAKSYSIHDHIGYFMAQNCFLEIDELEDTDCMKLIRCFRDDPGCDAVVIDAGSGINRKTTAMMRAADRIGIVLNGDPVAALKNKMFEDQFGMIFDQSENMPSRITIFHNRREERLPDSGSSSRLFSSCAFVHNIPYIPDVWQKPNDEAFRYESMNSLRTALTEAAVQMMEKTSAETRTVFAGKR